MIVYTWRARDAPWRAAWRWMITPVRRRALRASPQNRSAQMPSALDQGSITLAPTKRSGPEGPRANRLRPVGAVACNRGGVRRFHHGVQKGRDHMVGSSGRERPRRARLCVAGCLAGLGTVLGLGACEDNANFVQPISARAVTVFKDSTFNFTSLRTFAMPDTVVHFIPVSGPALNVSRQFDQVALDRVRQNLLVRGYTQVANPATTRPDFIVLVAA